MMLSSCCSQVLYEETRGPDDRVTSTVKESRHESEQLVADAAPWFVQDDHRSLLAARQRDEDLHRCVVPTGGAGRFLPGAHVPRSNGALEERRAQAVELRLIRERELP